MKKFIILVIVILALFTIEHPLIKEPREQLLGEGIGFLSTATKLNRFPAASMTKNQINDQLTLSRTEKEYVEKTFTTDESIQLFHLRYCRQGDLNLYFYGERLATVCDVISQSLDKKRTK